MANKRIIVADIPEAASILWRSCLEDLRRCLLKSERLFDETLLGELGEIEMPFGKYVGRMIWDIPLRYLDETISIMPPTWLVRRIREFVDHAMQQVGKLDCIGGDTCFPRVPNKTASDMWAEYNKKMREIATEFQEESHETST